VNTLALRQSDSGYLVEFYSVTLIAKPGSKALAGDIVRKAARIVPFGKIGPWLAADEAVDISFHLDGVDLVAGSDDEREFLASYAEDVRDEMKNLPVDVVCQREANRRKALFLADMDSTMIGQECVDELADFVGMKEHVAAITERAMRGEIEFEPALRERVALLKGLDASVVDKVIAERITLTPGGETLVRTMRANGAYTALVSGGFTLFTSQIAATIGFHENRANELIIADGKLAGLVREPILGREAKLASLIELRDGRSLAHEATMAVGDGANDLAMLSEAGLGVAFHAKPAVAEAAQARIDHGDLTALLYAQGYRKEEFVTAAMQ
jgi:phosphoserine phosphatase